MPEMNEWMIVTPRFATMLLAIKAPTKNAVTYGVYCRVYILYNIVLEPVLYNSDVFDLNIVPN